MQSSELMEKVVSYASQAKREVLGWLGLRSDGEYEPASIQDMRTILQKTRLAGLLPYQSYDDAAQLFRLVDGFGYTIEASPQTGASMEMANILTSLYASTPTGTGIQIQMMGSNNLSHTMDEYIGLRQKHVGMDSIFYKLIERRAKYYIKGSKTMLFPQQAYLLKDFRLIISVVLPGSIENQQDVDEAVMLRDGMLSTLKSAGFMGTTWRPEHLVQWVDTLTNLRRFNKYDEYPRPTYDSDRELRDQIVDLDQLVRVTDKGILFGSDEEGPMEARFMSVKSYPQRFGLWGMRDLLGDYFQATLHYNCPFVLTLGIHVLDYEKTKAAAQMKSARATTNSTSDMARFLPDLQEKKKDWDIVMKALDEGNNMVAIFHQLMLIAPPEKMSQAEQAAKAIWRARSFEINTDHYMQMKGYLCSLPMMLTKSLAADIKKIGGLSTKTTANAVSMSPMLAEWAGTRTPALKLFGRLGQHMNFDLFDNTQGNYNAAIAGVSGSGKSVLLNFIAESYLGLGVKVRIIDVGRSYEKLCKHVGGEFIEFTPEKEIRINPFTFVADLEEEMAMLKSIISLMIAPSRLLDDTERTHLEKAIRGVWKEKENETTISDIADYLFQGKTLVQMHVQEGQARRGSDMDKTAHRLAESLYQFTRVGTYGKYFDGPANVEFDNQFVVLELEELKSKKDLQAVVLLIMILRISQEMYLSRDTRKVVIIDEAWDLMGGGSTAEFIETGYRRARKYAGSFITATQGWDDFYKNTAATAALQNSDWQFMLRQKPESIEALIANKRLAVDEYLKRLILSLRTEHGQFSEVYVRSQLGSGVGRLIVNPFTLMMYSTKSEDFNAINSRVQGGMSYEQAIEDVLRERGIQE